MSFPGAIRARLRAMSRRERAMVLACAVAVAAAAAMKWAIVPARAEYRRTVESVRQQVLTIERYEAIRRGQDRIDGERARQAEQLKKWEGGLLAGESASAAGVFLQGLLKPLTQSEKIRMTSIRALPPVRRGEYVEIAVQMDLQTTTEELARLLAEIARQPKRLQVRRIDARVGSYFGRHHAPMENIAISIVVAGLSGAPMDGNGASAGGAP